MTMICDVCFREADTDTFSIAFGAFGSNFELCATCTDIDFWSVHEALNRLRHARKVHGLICDVLTDEKCKPCAIQYWRPTEQDLILQIDQYGRVPKMNLRDYVKINKHGIVWFRDQVSVERAAEIVTTARRRGWTLTTAPNMDFANFWEDSPVDDLKRVAAVLRSVSVIPE